MKNPGLVPGFFMGSFFLAPQFLHRRIRKEG